MGDFDKKKAFGVGGVLVATIAVLANLSQIIDTLRGFFDKPEKNETSNSIVEIVETTTKAKETKKTEEKVVEPETEPQPKAVYLDSLKVAESHGFYEDENTAESTVGDTYSGHVVTIGKVGVLDTDGDAYAMYYLGGKYKTLSGTIAVNDRTWEDGNGEILIFCDDNVIYQTGAVGRATALITLPEKLSVEGCQWLKISESTYNGTWDKDINFILADWKLEE